MKTSQRFNQLPANFFAGLNERIIELRQMGKDIIRLDIGSPDLPPDPAIIQALADSAALADTHGYQSHHGPLWLRQAWRDTYRRLHEIDLDPNRQILPLLGSKEGIFHLSQALLDPGDLVLVPDPGYITYTAGANFAGAEVLPLPLLAENDYLPDLEAIPPEAARRARLLWLNYPNNPTGATASRAFFEQAIEFARRNQVLVCHDAAYTQVAFDGYRPPSLLEIPGASEVAVEFNTLSKSHNMAGWRSGALLGNPEAVRAVLRLKTQLDSGHFLPIQQATATAMNADQSWLAERNAVYQARRDLVLQTLAELGLQARTPQASLYVWCSVPPGWTSLDFARELLEQAQVSLTPGTVFGPNGEGYLRIALTASLARIAAAAGRLRDWLPNLESPGRRQSPPSLNRKVLE
jgi:LL-diaminopimelate aminotransferase